MIRVLIADDQALMRQGFRMILSAEPDLEVIGEADTGTTAVRQVTALHPDVVLMDINMPVMDGITATQQLPGVKILILTTFGSDHHVAAALAAGASGFLLKDTTPEQLVHAVKVIAAGDALLDPAITRRLIQRALPSLTRPLADLTAFNGLSTREMDVLRLLAHGKSNAEIAADLVLAETTIKTHISHLLSKLGLRDRVQAVVLAHQHHLV